MNFLEARKLFFEDCVEFEWQIRQMANISKRPHRGPLSQQIEVLDIPKGLREKKPYIDMYSEIKKYKFRKAYLKKFKNARNRLAHKRGLKIMKTKDFILLENISKDILNIQKLNTKLTAISQIYEVNRKKYNEKEA